MLPVRLYPNRTPVVCNLVNLVICFYSYNYYFYYLRNKEVLTCVVCCDKTKQEFKNTCGSCFLCFLSVLKLLKYFTYLNSLNFLVMVFFLQKRQLHMDKIYYNRKICHCQFHSSTLKNTCTRSHFR